MQQLRRIGGLSSGHGLLGPAFAHTSVCLSIADLDGCFVEANAAFLQMIGRSPEELARETILSVTYPEDRDATRAGIAALLDGTETDFSQDKRYCRPDGVCIWVRNTVSVLRDDAGAPKYTFAISENIDARHHVEEALLHSRETLEVATAAGAVGIWDVDMRTGAMSYSNICRDIFGIPHDQELTLEDFYPCLHPEDRDRVRELIARVADPSTRSPYDIQYRAIRPNGEERWAHATGRAYFEPTATGERCVRFIGAIRDITDQRRSVEALIQAEKLAATGRLAASIAHEINNPLESVTNLLFLLRQTGDTEERQAYLQLAEQELQRISEIATQTLRFYRDPSGHTLCDLAAVLESVLTLFHGRVNLLGVRVAARFAPNSIVHGSQGELRQVFVNLVANALDAMSTGGRLDLRTRLGVHVPSGVRGVFVSIADTGQGMTSEVAARIFQPFFTTKQATGTGLGLWLSLEILNKHRASLRLRSCPGKGTAILIFVPSAH